MIMMMITFNSVKITAHLLSNIKRLLMLFNYYLSSQTADDEIMRVKPKAIQKYNCSYPNHNQIESKVKEKFKKIAMTMARKT